MTLRTRTINRRYRLERRIALDDTIETWLGFDAVLHRAVAVTMPRQELLREGPFLVQFLQRSRIATALHHRSIVAAFDSGEDGELPYLVTEYLGGEPLSDIIRAESPIDVDDVAVLIDQLSGALDYAHQRGFVHGQLTPAAVVVDSEGASKVLGFGLPAGTVDATNTGAGKAVFSIDADVAALGAIAFEMLTGEPFEGVAADSIVDAYLIDPDVPRGASDIVSIALGNGSARFVSAGAFARSLNNWRTFDPGEFFFSPESDGEVEPLFPEPVLQVSGPQSSAGFESEFEFDASEEVWEALPADPEARRARWVLVAAMALLVVALIIIWRSSEPTLADHAGLPAPVRSLAQMTGF